MAVKKDTKRIYITLDSAKVDALWAAAKDYGLPASTFVGMCAWVGFEKYVGRLMSGVIVESEEAVGVDKK